MIPAREKNLEHFHSSPARLTYKILTDYILTFAKNLMINFEKGGPPL
jgi:hypothetical protein